MHVTLIQMYFPGWFGIRKDFCQFLLSVFPLLQEYANIAYNNNVNRGANVVPSEPPEPYRDDETQKKVKESKKSQKNQKKNEIMKPVVPITSIDMPDWCLYSLVSAEMCVHSLDDIFCIDRASKYYYGAILNIC